MESIQQIFSDFIHIWDNYPWMLGIGIMLLSLVAAKVLDVVLIRFFKRFTSKTSNEVDDAILAQIHRPLELSVVLWGAVLVVKLLIADDHLKGSFVNVFLTILIVTWTWVAIRAFNIFFNHLISRRRSDSSVVQALPLFKNLIMVVLILHGAYWVMHIWDINVTPLLASAGIVTAAVALASKDTLANFFGGVSIFVDQPYRLGDYIILESGERGEVVNIGIRSTRILTRDDVLITVPNASLANSKIINQSGQVPRFRVRARVGVGYSSDLDLVEKTLLECCGDVPEILAYPNPRVRFREFGDSALIFELLFWIRDPGDRGRILHEVNRSIHTRLGRAGIEIPFPQRVVHLPPRGSSPAPLPKDD